MTENTDEPVTEPTPEEPGGEPTELTFPCPDCGADSTDCWMREEFTASGFQSIYGGTCPTDGPWQQEQVLGGDPDPDAGRPAPKEGDDE